MSRQFPIQVRRSPGVTSNEPHEKAHVLRTRARCVVSFFVGCWSADDRMNLTPINPRGRTKPNICYKERHNKTSSNPNQTCTLVEKSRRFSAIILGVLCRNLASEVIVITVIAVQSDLDTSLIHLSCCCRNIHNRSYVVANVEFHSAYQCAALKRHLLAPPEFPGEELALCVEQSVGTRFPR